MKPNNSQLVENRHLTKRAPDAGDSAAISSSFLRLSLFLAGRLRRPHPSAGNACRCPEAIATHAQMAVFLLRSKHTSAYTPPAVGGSTGFYDVPTSYWAAAWIKQIAAEGISYGAHGCGVGNYCPENAVTRAEMAGMLLRAFNLP